MFQNEWYYFFESSALEMPFNIFTTKRFPALPIRPNRRTSLPASCAVIKRPVHGQFLIDEFHFSAVFECFDPHSSASSYLYSRDQLLSRASLSRVSRTVFSLLPASPEQCADLPCPPQKGSRSRCSLFFTATRAIRGVAKNISRSRADFAMRGFAILLTLALCRFAELAFLVFVFIEHP